MSNIAKWTIALLVVFLVAFVLGIPQGSNLFGVPMKAETQTEKQVLAVFDQLSKAYTEQNLDEAGSLFVDDPTTVMLGSGADEKRVGLAEVKAGLQRDFTQAESATLKLSNSNISKLDSVAWLTCDMSVQAQVDGEGIHMNGRLTAVLVEQEGKWRIAQMHFSMPYGGQEEGKSWPTQR